MSKDETKKVSLEELPELRRKTEAVSNFLQGQLAQHLKTLRPLVAPGRRCINGRGESQWRWSRGGDHGAARAGGE